MTALIILAAGESARLGKPKQNLIFNGQTLLENAIKTGLAADCASVVVVLGAHADQIDAVHGVQTVYNHEWREGMASSIRHGIEAVVADDSIHQVILMPCDQPFVTSTLLNSMIGAAQQHYRSIVACRYNGITGPPALFKREWFGELELLKGMAGAKYILEAHLDEVQVIEFEQGVIDIDTVADYTALIENQNSKTNNKL